MTGTRFRLSARVSSASPASVSALLEQLLPQGSVRELEGDLLIDADLEGASAKDLNRALLSASRGVEKKTALRAQWMATDGTTQSFFDYLLKKTTSRRQ